MARIVSLGSALQDIYLVDRDDFVPSIVDGKSIFGEIQIGTKIDIDKVSFEIGGGGTNSAVSFARHGHESILLTNIGKDSAGEAILTLLDEEGIDSSYISISKNRHTGLSVILLDIKTGERTVLTHRGASSKYNNLDEEDLKLIYPDWLYVTTLRGDLETLEKFIEKAKSINCKVMLNPGKLELAQKSKFLKLLSHVDILLVNQKEASEIVPGQALTELLSHLANYVPTSIITTGSMGAIATNGKETYRLGIYEDLKVKDTNGAGDAFGAGFLAHLASGESFIDSLIFASANSTFVVSKLGAKAGILTGNEDLHHMPIQKITL